MALLDVLQQLPLDVVETNVWESLPKEDRSNFRLCSPASRLLVDPLFTSLDLTASKATDSPDPRARFLARLPCVVTLHVSAWLDNRHIATALAQYGDSTQGRVTALTAHHQHVCCWRGLPTAARAHPRAR